MLQYSDILTAPGAPAIPSLSATATTSGGIPAIPNVGGLNTATPSPTAGAAASTYTVAKGDTLSGIASKNNMSLQDLLGLNPQFKANPNLIKPGQNVTLKSGSTGGLTTTSSGLTVNPATGGVVTNSSTPSTPAIPQLPGSNPPPAAPKVQYGQLVNSNGTIFNTQNKTYYPNPDALAADLGVDKSAIDWTKIGPAGTDFNAPDYQIAEKQVADLMNPSQDETNTQGQIDSLESGTKLSQLNIEGQPIPMEFITGQQAAVEKRALALEEPLQKKLALMQAKRQGALSASQFTLSQMDKKISDARAQATANKPVEVGNGATLVDPKTGKVIYQAPYRSSAANGGGLTLGGYVPGQNPTVDAWIEAVQNGNATMQQVPANIRNQVAVGMAGGTPAKPVVDAATDVAVKQLIAANPATNQAGGKNNVNNGAAWDAAAKAIDAQFGAGTATKYDAWLKSVYENGQDPNSLGASSDIYSPLSASRYTMASNRIVSNFVQLPQYQLTAGGLPYLQRIAAAIKTPGSISDQDLLDSLTKLNTAGNAVTDAQVKLITDGKSLSDAVGVWTNKLTTGGVLSDNQRQQIVKIAREIYKNYQKGYQPVYDQVTQQLKASGIPPQFWTLPDLNKLGSKSGIDKEFGGSGESGGGSSGSNPLGI